MNKFQYSAIILAGGLSKRFLDDKLLAKINNELVVNHAIEHFINDKECLKIYLIVSPIKFDFYKKHFRFVSKIIPTKASQTRVLSTLSVLKNIQTPYVLIHDAARPYVSNELIVDVKEELNRTNTAIVPIVRPTEPLLKIKNNTKIDIYENEYYFSQTPQGYDLSTLLESFDQLPIETINQLNDVYDVYAMTNHDIVYINGDVNNKLIVYNSDIKSN